MAASPGFCFHLYEKHPFFSGQEYRSSQRSRESSTTSGSGLLWVAAAAAAALTVWVLAQGLLPGHPCPGHDSLWVCGAWDRPACCSLGDSDW